MGLNGFYLNIIVMKIFLPDINSQIVRFHDTRNDALVKTINIVNIYCLDGIYELCDNKIKKIEIIDNPCKKLLHMGHNIIIDNTQFKKNTNICNVESNHHVLNVQRIEYTLRRGAKIMLVVEKINSKIKQLYFDTTENIENFAISEDFVTLLSLFT
jgi:hypothetical protein